jgi:cytochrome c-type biogenesis protein CcmH/NrfF
MRRAAGLALLVLALLVLALLPAGAAAVKQRTSMSAVLPEVMCVTCQIPLSQAQSPQADDERSYIRQLIDRGDTLKQVKNALVVEYGDGVLALPPARGFDLTVYVVPVVVVLALLALLAVLLPRWRGNLRRAGDGAIAAPVELSEADAARLEEELGRY